MQTRFHSGRLGLGSGPSGSLSFKSWPTRGELALLERFELRLETFVYKQGAGSVRLILATVPRLGPTQEMRLPTGSQQILEVLRVAGKGLGTGEISEAISLSRPATTKRLRALQGEGWFRGAANRPAILELNGLWPRCQFDTAGIRSGNRLRVCDFVRIRSKSDVLLRIPRLNP